MRPTGLGVLCVSAVILALPSSPAGHAAFDLRALERSRVLSAAGKYLAEPPVTVTASRSPRSAGGPHDFFSEGDYWWPDPQNPGGPYVQRDGMSNPDNFVEHRRAMVRLGTIVPTLVSAYRLTGEARYAEHAMRHLRAWFVDADTRMAPHLRYAQAIQGRATGRGTGIIDTIHLVEVARSAERLAAASPGRPAGRRGGVIADADLRAVRRWFSDYLGWLTTHEYGVAERDAKNNHGTCWVMQVAAFAQLTGDATLLQFCRDRFMRVLVPEQMAQDGSFPLELKRTKPYGYSLFNLDAFATICQILSGRQPSNVGRNEASDRVKVSAVSFQPSAISGLPPESALTAGSWPLAADRFPRSSASFDTDLWTWALPDGRGMRRAMSFLYPYMHDKSTWPFAKDVMYFEQWPVRHPSLLFAGLAMNEPRYLDLWSSLDLSPATEEVIRNLPVRHPLLWVE